jgi:hypothetical protein
LRHWLAHHVAELIQTAEQASDSRAKKDAEKRATETILKVWKHRSDLPGHVNPLARYGEILQVLSDLRPDPQDWSARMGRNQGGAIGNLYQRFPRLLRALVLINLSQSAADAPATAKAVRKFIKEDENRLLSSLEARLGLLRDAPSAQSKRPRNDHEELNAIATKLIKETITDLKSFQILCKSSIYKKPRSK